jgi:hypothetical protein
MLIAHVDFILVASAAGGGSYIPCFQTLYRIREDTVVISVLGIFPFYLLQISCHMLQLLTLVPQLLFVVTS